MTSNATGPWLLAVAALCLGYAVHIGGGDAHPVAFPLLGLAIFTAGVAVGWGPRWRPPIAIDRLLLAGVMAQIAVMLVFPINQYLVGVDRFDPAWIGLLSVALVGALWLHRAGRMTSLALVVVIGAHFALGAWVIAHSPEPFIDVWHFQQDGIAALLSGTNPYLPIYEDIYGGSSPYYGPGIVEDGRLTVGLPYPPMSLYLAIPGYLVAGDHRWAQLVAIELAALVVMAIRPNRIGIGAALVVLFMPRTLLIVERGWTEPFGILLLAVTVLVASRAPKYAGVALGALVAVKQYLLIGLPLAVILLRSAAMDRWRLAVTTAATAALVTLPFLIWDPAALFNSTVRFLAVQPYRPGSLTFLSLLPVESTAAASVVAFALLLVSVSLVALRGHRGPAGLAAAIGFVLLVFFAFGKQGAINYYFLVIGAFCVAIAAWQVDAPAPAHAHADG